jgi:transcriptional regulator with XRE-family HTH domain
MSDPMIGWIRSAASRPGEARIDMANARRSSPTLRRRRLEDELKRLRLERGMPSTEVAKTLGWSQGKLSKMEGGEWIRPNPRDAEDLGRLYGVDEDKLAELVQLARDSREKDGWWYPYRKQISHEYSAYIGFEAGASELFVFEPLMVHGLLQTEDYARTVIAASSAELSPGQVEQRVEIRARRQDLLSRPDDPLRLWVVLHEAALRTLVGDGAAMGDQLGYLLEMAKLAKVSIQVIPFTAGAHAGITGGFTIMAFPEEQDPDVAYVENPAGQHFIEAAEEVTNFKVAFQRLQARALSLEDSAVFIAEMAK